MDDAIIHQYNVASSFSQITPWLRSSPIEHPLAVQLGGGGMGSCTTSVNSESVSNFASAAEIVCAYASNHNDFPFTELNVNSGCPSSKAVSRGFGADLMRLSSTSHTRALLSETVRRVGSRVDVTLKCRIGCVEQYRNGRPRGGEDARMGYEGLRSYVADAVSAGVKKVILHSRICVLNGFSTGKNRTVPPLLYDVTSRVVRDFPDVEIVLNGGVNSLEMCESVLGGSHLGGSNEDEIWGWKEGESDLSTFRPKGVMVGRWAYNDVAGMWDADGRFYGKVNRDPTFRTVLDEYVEHCEGLEGERTRKMDALPNIVKPMHNIFCGVKGNKQYKQALDEAVKVWAKKEGGDRGGIREILEGVLDQGHISVDVLEGRISEQRKRT